MALVQFLIDDFSDGIVDTNLWNTFSNPGISESGGQMRFAPTNAGWEPIAASRNYVDLSKGYLAFKMSKTGTANGNIYTEIGLFDIASKVTYLGGRSDQATFFPSVIDLGAGTSTSVDTTVAFGPSWVNGTWLGWDYTPSNQRLHLSKSTDGVNWTEIWKYQFTTVPGMDLTRVRGIIGAHNYATSGTGNLVWTYDDYSYFPRDSSLKLKVRYNGAWVSARPRVRYSGAWKNSVAKARFGSQWDRSSAT
jgi:hypothetical protein